MIDLLGDSELSAGVSIFDNLCDITKSKLARKQTIATKIFITTARIIEQVWKNNSDFFENDEE